LNQGKVLPHPIYVSLELWSNTYKKQKHIFEEMSTQSKWGNHSSTMCPGWEAFKAFSCSRKRHFWWNSLANFYPGSSIPNSYSVIWSYPWIAPLFLQL